MSQPVVAGGVARDSVVEERRVAGEGVGCRGLVHLVTMPGSQDEVPVVRTTNQRPYTKTHEINTMKCIF